MTKTKLLTSIFLLLYSFASVGKDITDQSFVGKWCGKWDQIYEFCLTIDSIEPDAVAKYQWKEFTDGKFKKDTKSIVQINRNTLKMDKILFVLDENNLLQANAVGIFRVKTRMSTLSKQITKKQL
ncbi:MAG: hypothetical protein ACPGJI_02890 [Kangiellaceae bacterium]